MRDLDIGNGIVVAGDALRAVTSRSGGPGGQNVNKVETRVTIELELLALPDGIRERVAERLATRINRAGVLRVTSQTARTQSDNRDRALDRMEELLREALRERTPRRKTRVPKGVKARRVDEKKRRGETKRLRGRVL